MPRVRRGRKPKITSEDNVKLSLKDIEEAIDDPTIFNGVLAYKNLQKNYIDTPKDPSMTLTEFEAIIEDFKKQKIYKTKVDVNPEQESTQTTPQPEDSTTTKEKQEGS